MNTYTHMSTFSGLYNLIWKNSKKERFEIILEPLQAIVQLALMSYCPTGTKFTLSNNLLFVQQAYFGHSVVRTYYSDSKDDLVYLFNVIVRYHKFYSYIQDYDDEEKYLFNKLITLAKRGIDNLLQTYTQSGEHALLHTLQMYKIMLDKPELYETQEVSSDEENVDLTTPEKNIDDIFENIKNIYTNRDLRIIYNLFMLIENDTSNYVIYMDGLNKICEPINVKIKKWINDNIVF